MSIPDEVPLIAAKFAVISDIGDAVEDEIAQSATYLLTHQLGNKALEETAAKYALPSNCQAVDFPKVNPFIWDNLPTNTKSKDLKLQNIQKSLTKGINAFTRSLSSDNITDSQQDALALLCNSSFELNCLRRELIKPDLDAKCARLCKPENMVGTSTSKLLFGDNLSKKVKDLMEEQKVTAGVMKGHRKSYSSPHPYRGYKPSPGFTTGASSSNPTEALSLVEVRYDQPFVPSHDTPTVGGRLYAFQENWRAITSDPFILDAIKGYKLEFEATLPPSRDKPPRHQDETPR